MIRQQLQVELGFEYELCAVPSSLVDGQGCLRKASKSALSKRLSIAAVLPDSPDTLIVDVSQLFYHIVWPHGGQPLDLIASIQARLRQYPDNTEKIVVFEKHHDV